MGRLDVRIVEARNLTNTELIGKPDPYVCVEIENTKHKTSVADSTLNPKWDEVFKFTVADPDSAQMEMKLWDSNVMSDKYMGEYQINLSGLTQGVVKDCWCLLKQSKSNAEIHIRLMAHDFGAQPPAAAGAVAAAPVPVAQPQMAPPMQAPPQQQPMAGFAQQQQPQMQPQMQQQQYQQPQMAPGYPPQQQQPGYPPQQMGGMMQNQMGMMQNQMGGMMQQQQQQQPSQVIGDFQPVNMMSMPRRVTYGPASTPPQANRDFTQQMQMMFNQGQRSFVGGAHLVLGDPAPGAPKSLAIWY